MENRFGPRQSAAADQFEEVALVEIVGDFAVGQIAELVCPGQVVDRDDVRQALVVERLDVVGADETGCTGHDDHAPSPPKSSS